MDGPLTGTPRALRGWSNPPSVNSMLRKTQCLNGSLQNEQHSKPIPLLLGDASGFPMRSRCLRREFISDDIIMEEHTASKDRNQHLFSLA